MPGSGKFIEFVLVLLVVIGLKILSFIACPDNSANTGLSSESDEDVDEAQQDASVIPVMSVV